MVVYITIPDELFIKISEEAKQKGMDGKKYIKMLLEQYAYRKELGISGGSVDLSPVLAKLESIESKLARIEERLSNLEQKTSYQQRREYRPYQRSYERVEYQIEELDPLEEAVRYAKQVLINNNNVITDEQLEKIAEKFKVSKMDIVKRLYLVEVESGKWVPQ